MINRIEFNSQYDGVVICEWSGNWEFGAVENNITSVNANIISIRIIVNGIEVCEIYRSSDWAIEDCGYGCGAIPFPAGIVRIEAEAKIQNMQPDFALKLIECLKVSPEQFNLKDKYGNTPLYYAIHEGKKDIAMKLIELLKIDFLSLQKFL